jgi:hypothetical protein
MTQYLEEKVILQKKMDIELEEDYVNVTYPDLKQKARETVAYITKSGFLSTVLVDEQWEYNNALLDEYNPSDVRIQVKMGDMELW